MLARALLFTTICLVPLLGCSRYDDPLASGSVYRGLNPTSPPEGNLVRVLDTAKRTPGKQGFLYIAMQEAEVAAQFAGRAAASPDDVNVVKSSIGEVVYAVEPAAAPDWMAKFYGIVSGWAGRGYGVRRASDNLGNSIDQAIDDDDGLTGLAEYGPLAQSCVGNTAARADEILELGRQVLASGGDADLEPKLDRIWTLALALNQGTDADAPGGAGTAGCGLRQAKQFLDRIAPATATG